MRIYDQIEKWKLTNWDYGMTKLEIWHDQIEKMKWSIQIYYILDFRIIFPIWESWSQNENMTYSQIENHILKLRIWHDRFENILVSILE